jgi:hypothetical protein
MRYHQVNDEDELMTGICLSTPEMIGFFLVCSSVEI